MIVYFARIGFDRDWCVLLRDAILSIDTSITVDRIAELFELCMELAEARQGIDADAEEDVEPVLTEEIFVDAVQAYGYRINMSGVWVRDHPPHTQYVVYQDQVVPKLTSHD